MEVDESFKSDHIIKFKCNVCKYDFEIKDNLMKHKKIMHEENVKTCVRFSEGVCTRNTDTCWYSHTSEEKKPQSQPKKSPAQAQVFHEAPRDLIPPDHLLKEMMAIMTKLSIQVETMEHRIAELVN